MDHESRPFKPAQRRTRSLKDLLQLPLLSRISDSTVTLPTNLPLPGILPCDIFLEISEWLWQDDILSLSLTVRYQHYSLTNSLSFIYDF